MINTILIKTNRTGYHVTEYNTDMFRLLKITIFKKYDTRQNVVLYRTAPLIISDK